MEVIIGIKPTPGDHESNFKKVGSIPFWFKTMGTKMWISKIFNKKAFCTFYIEIYYVEIKRYGYFAYDLKLKKDFCYFFQTNLDPCKNLKEFNLSITINLLINIFV